MAVGFRHRLGMGLQSLVETPEQQAEAQRLGTAFGAPAMPQTAQVAPKKHGLGRTVAGSLGDFLLQQAGMAPVYAPAQQQRRAEEQAEVQWQRNRHAQNEDWMARQQYENTNRPDDEFTRMMRAAGIDPASAQGRGMYQQRIERQTAEPDVVVTLANGQLYIGPKSGLAAALQGGGAATPARPVGGLTPIEGGPGGSPSGAGFRP
jgi:hypothetical protein